MPNKPSRFAGKKKTRFDTKEKYSVQYNIFKLQSFTLPKFYLQRHKKDS